MTLIAAVRCKDGYLIAADTAITVGDSVEQGHKIDYYMGSGPSGSYKLFVAFAGSMTYGKMASQKLRDRVAANGGPRDMTDINLAIQDVVKEVYEDLMTVFGKIPDGCSFWLVAAAQDAEGKFAVFATDATAVIEVPVAGFVFEGTGREVATALATQMQFEIRPPSTAIAAILVHQIFKDAKNRCSGVGGTTEMIASRMTEDADPFFQPAANDTTYLWGLEHNLHSSLRSALETGDTWTPEQSRLKVIENNLHRISRRSTQYSKERRLLRWIAPGLGGSSLQDIKD